MRVGSARGRRCTLRTRAVPSGSGTKMIRCARSLKSGGRGRASRASAKSWVREKKCSRQLHRVPMVIASRQNEKMATCRKLTTPWAIRSSCLETNHSVVSSQVYKRSRTSIKGKKISAAHFIPSKITHQRYSLIPWHLASHRSPMQAPEAS